MPWTSIDLFFTFISDGGLIIEVNFGPYQTSIAKICNENKDVVLNRIEHEYLLDCINFAANSCFMVFHPHKYHIWLKIVPKLMHIFMTWKNRVINL